MNSLSFHLPDPSSHKGQNGKVMIIGGSTLFHAASKWSLDIASRLVDMVFYSSIPENNQLIQTAKSEFWNGIVVERAQLASYLEEADTILIGPGMVRQKKVSDDWFQKLLVAQNSPEELEKIRTEIDWNDDTYAVTNYLVAKYPDKKWVIDAGALQMIEPALLQPQMIVTPHLGELEMLLRHQSGLPTDQVQNFLAEIHQLQEMETPELSEKIKKTAVEISRALQQVTLVIKGRYDVIISAEKIELVSGGNAGMTKGGTGDVLAGLIAGLYATQEQWTAAVMGSQINKKAGDSLYQKVGPYFNTSQLLEEIPVMLWQSVNTPAHN